MSRTIVRGGSVFDGTGTPVADGDVVFEAGRIVDVGPGLDGDEEVDASGLTVLPGMFDCHVHVMASHVDLWKVLNAPFSYRFYEAAHNLRSTLEAGITTVRDAGGADLGVRRAVEDGLIFGPRMQISIRMLSQTGGHGDCWMVSGDRIHLFPVHPGSPEALVDGPDEMRKKVRELIRYGADVIKVATSGGVLSPRDNPRHAHFRPAELDVLVEEATAAGLPAMAHAQSSDGIKAAVRAGIRSIEHGIYLDDEAIDLMLERGTYLVATLVAPAGVVRAAEAGAQIPEASLNKALEVMEDHKASFSSAVEAGVNIAMGTDSGITPHGENLDELALMRDGGMKPEDVLVAATQSAARLMEVEHELGTLEPGKRADLVLVRGDCFEFENLRDNIVSVFKDGELVAGVGGES